jgi:hypothetical protein
MGRRGGGSPLDRWKLTKKDKALNQKIGNGIVSTGKILVLLSMPPALELYIIGKIGLKIAKAGFGIAGGILNIFRR